MCDPLTITMASAGVQAVGAVSQGRAAKSQAYGEAGQLDYQAALERDNAVAEAALIRRAGDRARGETLAGIAGAGIKIGEGSALDAERQVMEDAEVDAQLALLTGDRSARSLEASAKQRRAAGRAASRAGYMQGFTSLLSAGSRGYFTGAQQAPAPIVSRDFRG
jgi:hypothetical protein